MTEMLRSGSVMTRAAMGRAPTTAFGLSCFAFVAVLATRFASAPPGFRHLTEPASDKFGKNLGFTDFDPARPALGYAAVQVVSFLVWGCVLQRPLPCLDKTSSGLEMYLSIGNRQHFRWNSKDQRGLGMRRFASTRSGSATRSVLYYKNIYLCAIRFFRRYAILLSLVAPKGLRTR